METLESIKKQLRAMTAKQREAQEKECEMIAAHPSATAENRAEARMILQAIAELEREREERVQRANKAATEIAGIMRGAQEEQQARILAKAMRINETATSRPQQGRPANVQTDAKRANLHEMSQQAYNELAKWYNTGTIPALISAIDEIYKALAGGADDKDVARKMHDVYSEMPDVKNAHKIGRRAKYPWRCFRDDFAAAYGVQIAPYKPAQLK